MVPVSGPLAGKTIYGSFYALLIGINEYAHLGKEKWLSFAANDVKALREVLTKHYGFPEEHITVLLDAQATGEGIRRALASLVDRRKVKPEDRILIYFSGHGQTVKLQSGGEMGFLIPHDARVDFEDAENPAPYMLSCLPMRAVWDYLESSPAKHVLLLADACYSGLLARPRAVTSISEEALAALAGRRAIQVVTAGRRGEVSYELTRYGHGAFTHKLLEELKAKATTPGAVFTATELYASVKRGVAELSKGKQTPQMGDYDTEGDFLFITASHPAQPAVKPSRPSAASLQPPANPQPGEVWVCPTDGAEMVFVPGGVCLLGNDQHFEDERPQHCVSVAGFWMDKHEVTNQQFARFLNATGRSADAGIRDLLLVDANLQMEEINHRWQARRGKEHHPVVNVSWHGALAYAQWAGKRLPTEAEWCRAAQGEDGRRFPWGNDWDPRNANTAEPGDGFANTAPVGSFPAGASPFGCMDMCGNVWEWTSSQYRPFPYRADDGREELNGNAGRVLIGGGFECGNVPLYQRFGNAPSAWANHRGFRCAMPSGQSGNLTHTTGAPLAGMPTLSGNPAPAIQHQPGQVWLCPTDGAAMVYVPAGESIMGSEGGGYAPHLNLFDNEKPLHQVTLPAFWIDKHEVTAAQYARFLNEVGVTKDAQGHAYFQMAPDTPIQRVKERWAPKVDKDRHPMIRVTWHGAGAYATWAGKRLPTEAEWEKAARGLDSRKYPWGNDPAAVKWAAWGSSTPQGTYPVGSFPADTSPHGCMDMAGNAWEWTSSLEQPYPYRPDDGREDPNAPGKRVARGGGIDVWPMGRTSYRAGFDGHPRAWHMMGFRCARFAE